LTVYMIIPILIVGVGSAFLAKTGSSASRTIGLTELPVTHDDVLARDETGENCPGSFSTIWDRYRRGPNSGQCSGR